MRERVKKASNILALYENSFDLMNILKRSWRHPRVSWTALWEPLKARAPVYGSMGVQGNRARGVVHEKREERERLQETAVYREK